ncbi:ROK family transcriptional regulator [Oceanotoga teriensis]|uniref:ROK family transcriptional regulator n=1 Tax=Oceanotoga teriensis TaxID=515440 RepID=UPI0027128B49|nr:ROK family transcriptional regulator [Oceanotoga teriensis]MDO7977454.1 ROK family transcriptional regulator [Oceanotoga teriensis]
MKFTYTHHQIIKYIYLKENFTRPELVKNLKMDKSTISRNIDYLINKGFILKKGEILPDKKGGRKTDLLTINKNKFYFIGVSIEDCRNIALLTNLNGEIIKEFSFKEKIRENNIIQYLDTIMNTFEAFNENILSFNLAVPGIIDKKNGIIIKSTDLRIENLNIKNIFESKYNIYLNIENDANAAVSNYLMDLKMKYSNLVYFMLSFPENILNFKGIGIGMVIDKKVYHGSHFAAGEVIFNSQYKRNSKNSLTSEMIKNYNFKNKNEDIEYFIDILSEKIADITQLIDPDYVIFGGDIDLFSNEFINKLYSKVYNKIHYNFLQNNIITDKNGIITIAKGAIFSFINFILNDYEFSRKLIKIS